MTIISPVITEKAMASASRSSFTFKVAPSSSKHQVKQAVEQTFKVHVTRVNITRRHVPAARTGSKRLLGQSSFIKLAVVTLKAGEKIDLFELKDK